MFRKANILFLIAETPMHAGSGDSLGIVDLPIQRERHTSFPKIEASSLKGSMREHFERKLGVNNTQILAAFGDEGQGGESSKAGCLGFTDARLLLFPVKSMKGVFAWITCPKIIAKLNEELKLAGVNESFNIDKGNLVAGDNNLIVNNDKIILEEYTFEVEGNEEVKKLGIFLKNNLFGQTDSSYFAQKLEKDIVVLEDDDFRDFVNLSTEVITRTKIDNETGTVAEGALFTEEYLPAESIMYSLVFFAPEFVEKNTEKIFKTEDEVEKFFSGFVCNNPIMQIGGNATLGKGITRIKVLKNS